MSPSRPATAPPARRPSNVFADCVAAEMSRVVRGRHADAVAPRSETHRLVTKAATTPMLLTDTDLAAITQIDATGEFIAGLAGQCAGAALLSAAVRVPVDSAGLKIPSAVAAADSVAWTKDGDPIKVSGASLNGAVLKPYRLAGIFAMTSEVAKRGAGEAMARQLLAESVTLALDLALFADTAETDTQPGGLLFGATSIAAFPGSDRVAVIADISALIAATAAVGGGSVMLATDPATAARLSMLLGSSAPVPVLASTALPAGRLVAVATGALAASADATPSIDVATDATLHMDSVPAEIVAAGGQPAAPTRSLWQTDAIAVRVQLTIGWVLRAPVGTAVAYVPGVSW